MIAVSDTDIVGGLVLATVAAVWLIRDGITSLLASRRAEHDRDA